MKIKAQNLRFREVTEKPQKKTAHAKVKVFSEQENWCSPLDYEPPRKKRRTGGETALVDDDDDEEVSCFYCSLFPFPSFSLF